MYPPVTASTSVIKTQTFTRKGKGVNFYPSSSDPSRRKFDGPPKNGAAVADTVQDTHSFHSSSHSSDAWGTGSMGSNGSSPGTPTSPSVSSPLSRTSSVGSNEDRSVARQGLTVTAPKVLPPMLQTRSISKTYTSGTSNSGKSKNNHQQTANASAAPRASKGSLRPFNHKEVVEYMNKAFREAEKSIKAGHGKFYDPKEHGAPIAFTPFDWEEFWKQRKMIGLI